MPTANAIDNTSGQNTDADQDGVNQLLEKLTTAAPVTVHVEPSQKEGNIFEFQTMSCFFIEAKIFSYIFSANINDQ